MPHFHSQADEDAYLRDLHAFGSAIITIDGKHVPLHQRRDLEDLATVRRAIDNIGIDRFALRYELARRTVERIYSGKKPCPPRLLETLRALEPAQDPRHGAGTANISGVAPSVAGGER